jgi:hypothetical protein
MKKLKKLAKLTRRLILIGLLLNPSNDFEPARLNVEINGDVIINVYEPG